MMQQPDTFTSDAHENGLVCGYVLDGHGGAREISPDELNRDFGAAVSWLHLDFSHPQAREWILNHSGLQEHMAEAMIADDSRPNCMVNEQGVLTVLRGVNLNPGSEMDDMISIRVFISENRIISTRRRKLRSVVALRQDLSEGIGPTDPSSFLVQLISSLGERIGEAIEGINQRLDEAESAPDGGGATAYRSLYSEVRRETARMRRYLAPQREALDRLSRVRSTYLNQHFEMDVHEQTNWMTLFIEELDLARERAMVAQEEMLSVLAHEQNSKMFILSIVAAVFLPLAFFTGLMGMNVAGLPGTENPASFSIVVVLMFAAAGLIVWYFKRKRWF